MTRRAVIGEARGEAGQPATWPNLHSRVFTIEWSAGLLA